MVSIGVWVDVDNGSGVCVSKPEHNALQEIDAEILETERLIHQRLNELVVGLKKGLDVWEQEKRIAEMHVVLQELRKSRKSIVRASFVGSAGKATAPASASQETLAADVPTRCFR